MPREEIAETIAETMSRLEALVGSVVEREGFELFDLEYKGSGGKRPLLRVLIDRPGRTSYAPPERDPSSGTLAESGVDIGACVRVTKALGPVLDVEDLLSAAYTLEVSSPGLARPLRRAEHFSRAVGLKVRVKTRVPVRGSESFFIAPLEGATDEAIELGVRGEPLRIPIRLISKAHLEPDL